MEDTLLILILEDAPERIYQFNQRILELEGRATFRHTDDVNKALRWCRAQRFDVIFVDHDLCLEHYSNEERDSDLAEALAKRTGAFFAKSLAERPEDVAKHGLFVVHSLNPSGADNIASHLEPHAPCIKVPFVWQSQRLFSKALASLPNQPG